MPRLVLLAALLVMSCAHRTRVVIPETPEGNNCARECMNMHNQCVLAYGKEDAARCQKQTHRCRMTCPGAQEVER